MEEVSLKKCHNCKREIATSNFVIHEIHCIKNIILCQQCKEPVSKVNLKEHFEEFHKAVPCDECHQNIERQYLEKHKNDECLKRQQLCEYCELSLPFDRLKEHSSYCGTRTEHCVKCSQFIMIKDLKIHLESSCRLPSIKPTSDSSGVSLNGVKKYADVTPKDVVLKSARPKVVSDHRLSAINSKTSSNNTSYSATNIAVKPPTQHIYSDQTGKHEQDPRSNNLQNNEFLKGNVFPCEFCDILFPSDLLFQHQVMCDRCESRNEGASYDGRNVQREQIISSDNFYWTDEDVMLPCEFCYEVYPTSDLIIHQSICEMDTRNDSKRSVQKENHDFDRRMKSSLLPSRRLNSGTYRPSVTYPIKSKTNSISASPSVNRVQQLPSSHQTPTTSYPSSNRLHAAKDSSSTVKKVATPIDQKASISSSNAVVKSRTQRPDMTGSLSSKENPAAITERKNLLKIASTNRLKPDERRNGATLNRNMPNRSLSETNSTTKERLWNKKSLELQKNGSK